MADIRDVAPSTGPWPQIGDILVNHDGDCPPPTAELAGRTFSLFGSDGERLELVFDAADGLVMRAGAGARQLRCQVHRLRDAYLVSCEAEAASRSVATIYLDPDGGRALVIATSLPAPDEGGGDLLTRVAQRRSQSLVGMRFEVFSTEAERSEFARGTGLVGGYFRYRYSDTHVYDHIYLSERYYAWFCHAGPDQGLGDFDECDHFELGPDLHLLCWREKLIPCGAVTIEDHRAMRSLGVIMGSDTDTGGIASSVVSARISRVADIAWTGDAPLDRIAAVRTGKAST
jgi:hypothetical protein